MPTTLKLTWNQTSWQNRKGMQLQIQLTLHEQDLVAGLYKKYLNWLQMGALANKNHIWKIRRFKARQVTDRVSHHQKQVHISCRWFCLACAVTAPNRAPTAWVVILSLSIVASCKCLNAACHSNHGLNINLVHHEMYLTVNLTKFN